MFFNKKMKTHSIKEEGDFSKKQFKAKLENIKSKYILQIIFDNFKKKKFLELIKYNKNLQQKIDLNINKYKEYSEIYSTIEIEIIPIKLNFGKFINIDSSEREYYHIYFNNEDKEIERTSLYINDEVTNIKIIIDYKATTFEKLFAGCKCIESIYFKQFANTNIIFHFIVVEYFAFFSNIPRQ